MSKSRQISVQKSAATVVVRLANLDSESNGLPIGRVSFGVDRPSRCLIQFNRHFLASSLTLRSRVSRRSFGWASLHSCEQ